MTAYTITKNEKWNSLEISFSEKPSEAIRSLLKSYSFRWNPKRSIWYGFAELEELEKALETGLTKAIKKTSKKADKEKEFDFNVKVGDLFYSSWGYEQTNITFFQVVELVGKKSVRVIEVYPELKEEKAVSSMSSDRTYKIPTGILESRENSIFINDTIKGDLKRLKSYHKDSYNNPTFEAGRSAGFCYKYEGQELYESWYY